MTHKIILSEGLANYTIELSFTDLGNTEVHGVKRSILDSLACAVDGYDREWNQGSVC